MCAPWSLQRKFKVTKRAIDWQETSGEELALDVRLTEREVPRLPVVQDVRVGHASGDVDGDGPGAAARDETASPQRSRPRMMRAELELEACVPLGPSHEGRECLESVSVGHDEIDDAQIF